MKVFFVPALIVLLSVPAHGQTAPAEGAFGLGVSFSGDVGTNNATLSNGLSGMYWVDNHFVLSGGLALASISDVATIFTVSIGGLYHFNRNQLSPLVGGAMFINVVSPSGAGASTTQFGFLLGGGAEYFFSKNFGALVTQGLQFNTEPTTFGLVSRFGLEWYF